MKSLIAAMLLALAGTSALAAESSVWTPLEFLVGTWQGEGKAEDTSGKGSMSFEWELDRQLLVRRDRTEYAATDKHPAFTHEALMVIYKNPFSEQIEANYYDNEHHVIHYKLAKTGQPDSVHDSIQFVSDSVGPTFRLSYVQKNATDIAVDFEMKMPGDNAAFQTLASGTVHRR
jgi:hypothetical protein